SCGAGPSDDDPFVEVARDFVGLLAPGAEGGKTVCAHTFNPACLRSRWRGFAAGDREAVEIACSLCSAEGRIPPVMW
ncbi:hypothetical protein B0H14DRAFT_2309325, partial [Mycena olivaceomarginata]